jgi:2-dehydropantoate 2-reductase
MTIERPPSVTLKVRVAIIGAGAVGGYVGAYLTDAGVDVVLVDPWPEHVEAMRSQGLEISGASDDERLVASVNAIHLTELQAVGPAHPIDIAFIAVKSYDTDWATMLVRQYLSPAGYCVSLQNCVNEDRIAAIVGWGRTVGCVVSGSIGVELSAPARIRRGYSLNPGIASFYVGEPHGRVTRRLEELGELMRAVGPTEVTANLWGERWSKLCLNAMRNAVSAATGLTGMERDSDDEVRRVSIELGAEAVKVGRALGYSFDEVGRFDADDLALVADGDQAALARVQQTYAADARALVRTAYQLPSMAQDIAKGRRTEIESMNGFIASRGKEIGVPAPVNQGVTDLVVRIERGQLKSSRQALFDGLRTSGPSAACRIVNGAQHATSEQGGAT